MYQLSPQDVIRITRRNKKDGVYVETAIVTSVVHGSKDVKGRDCVSFAYHPSNLLDSVRCSHGVAFAPYTPAEYGVQAIEIIGKAKPAAQLWTPAPGNRHYDLVH